MKIADYELSRIEAKAVGYYHAAGVPFAHEPKASWRGWGSIYVTENNKQRHIYDTIVITGCVVTYPGTPKEQFQLTIVGPRKLFQKVGSHNLLRKHMEPVAQHMGCTLEVNYAKQHSRNDQYITITMKRKQ